MFMAPTGAQKSEKPQFSFSDSAQTGITAHQFFVAHGFKSDLIKNIAAHGSDAHDLSFSEHAVLHPVAGLQILRFCGCRCRRFCLGSGAQNIAPGMIDQLGLPGGDTLSPAPPCSVSSEINSSGISFTNLDS